MGRATLLRDDYDGPRLRDLAKRSKDAGQSRRLLALSVIYDGGSRTDAARIGCVGLQVIRDWVTRFNLSGPEGLINGKSSGRPPKLDATHRQPLYDLVEQGPIAAIHGVVRWRLKDLALWLQEEHGISVSESTVSRELKSLGFSKITARPRHNGQSEFSIEEFKKNFPAELDNIRADLPTGTPIELWWQDEARVGQKTKLTRRWARRGPAPERPWISAQNQLISSAQSVRSAASVRHSFCRAAIPRRCNGISMKSRLKSLRLPMPFSSSTVQAGIPRTNF